MHMYLYAKQDTSSIPHMLEKDTNMLVVGIQNKLNIIMWISNERSKLKMVKSLGKIKIYRENQ